MIHSFALEFSEDYLTESQSATRLGIDNSLPSILRPNLIRVSEMLEDLQDKLLDLYDSQGRINVSSGYRCSALNSHPSIGGSNTSAHVQALAVDITFAGMKPYDLAKFIAENCVDYDQIIHEFGRWVHVGLSAQGVVPRHELLTAIKRKNTAGILKTVYLTGIQEV